MRTAAKVDTTQRSIVRALRAEGIGVSILREGRGIPDLLCGYRGHLCLIECKTGSGKLNKQQLKFREECQGTVIVANSPEDAISQFWAWWSDGP